VPERPAAAGARKVSDTFLAQRAPRAPSVTRAGAPVRAASTAAAASGSCSPVSSAASPAFGVRIGPNASSSSVISPAGAGLSTTAPPAARAAARRAASGISWLVSTTPGPAARTARSTAAASTCWLAPEATAIWFSPAASTLISATPVGTSARATQPVSTPSPRRSSSAWSPNASPPTAPTIVTLAPSRAAATAALAPLPPPCWEKRPPETVSPGAGSRSPTTTRSVLIEPTTMTRGRVTAGSLGARLTAAERQ